MSYFLIVLLILFSVVASVTLAFFFDSEFGTNNTTMTGKVQIKAVGMGDLTIEDDASCNLVIYLDDEYDVLIPGMDINIVANCKVLQSSTKPLLRAKIDMNLADRQTGEELTDSLEIMEDMYGQLCSDIELAGKWFQYTDGYFYYLGDVDQKGATGGNQVMEEIDVTGDDKVITFIPGEITFPTYVDSSYSSLGVYVKITFQAIQNFIPDSEGDQVDNTIINSQKIFSDF